MQFTDVSVLFFLRLNKKKREDEIVDDPNLSIKLKQINSYVNFKLSGSWLGEKVCLILIIVPAPVVPMYHYYNRYFITNLKNWS